MVAVKLVKDHYSSISDQILIAFRFQCLLYLCEGLTVLTEDDKVAELVVQVLHTGNDSSNKSLLGHFLYKDQLVCITVFPQRTDSYALTLREREAELLRCSLAHSSTESQYNGPLGKQTW